IKYLEKYYFQTQCSLPKGTSPNADEYCSLVTNTLSCGLFVNLIDFMKIFFCKFKLSLLPVYGLCNVFMLVGLFSLLHMMTKYFFFPNLVTLIEFAPMTQFGFSYLFFAPCLLMPYYTSAWPTCSVKVEKLSRLQFAKLIGDAMRHFLTGIMVLCVRGYKVEGVTLWSCIIFMMLGILYLTLVSNRKHHIHADNMESSKHLVLLELRVLAFILIFCIVLITILAVSYSTFARNKLPKKEKHGSFSDMESDDEILGSYPKQRIYSRRHIWLQTVNGNRIMRDSHVVYRFLMVPIFFVLAHFIPVISKDRYLIGWVKYINCLCFLALPVLCLFHQFDAVQFIVVAIVCWTSSLLVYISTHSMRRPDHVWLYSLLGLAMSSVAMCVLCREIENLTWQYIGLRFDLLPDLNALMYFGLGEMFSEAILIKGLQLRKMWDASFGAVMSMTTYGVFLAFPLLYYHDCYNSNSKIIATASTETCMLFMLLILTTSLLHISMSGYELRTSLFVYLMAETLVYVIFQWMTHHTSVYPLTFLHNLK
ncbi:hypothetical protein KR059_011087, partial [Drosophila kikkawai]